MKVCSSVLCTTPPSPQMVSSSVLSVFLRLGGICKHAPLIASPTQLLMAQHTSPLCCAGACVSQGCSSFLLSTLAFRPALFASF